jgi:hypothetical protein
VAIAAIIIRARFMGLSLWVDGELSQGAILMS